MRARFPKAFILVFVTLVIAGCPLGRKDNELGGECYDANAMVCSQGQCAFSAATK